MKKSHLPFHFFWTTEAGLTGVLVFLVLFLVASVLLDEYDFFKIFSLFFLSLFFLSGVLSISAHPLARLVFGGLVLAALGFVWGDYFFPAMGLRTGRILAGMLSIGFLAVMLLRLVFYEGAITYHRICGAIAIYLLIAWIWSNIYLLTLRFNPGAIELPPGVMSGSFEGLEATMFYFSVVTLTTLGYGDIVPVSSGARLAVMLEAFFGQLYPAIMLAWLVSMEILSRSQKR